MANNDSDNEDYEVKNTTIKADEKAEDFKKMLARLNKLSDTTKYELIKSLPENLVSQFKQEAEEALDKVEELPENDERKPSRHEKDFIKWHDRLKQSANQKVYQLVEGMLKDDIVADIDANFDGVENITDAREKIVRTIGQVRTTEFLCCYNYMVFGYQMDQLFHHWRKTWKPEVCKDTKKQRTWEKTVEAVTKGEYSVDYIRKIRKVSKLLMCYPKLLFASTSLHDLIVHYPRLLILIETSKTDADFWADQKGLKEFKMVIDLKKREVKIPNAEETSTQAKREELLKYGKAPDAEEKIAINSERARKLNQRKNGENQREKNTKESFFSKDNQKKSKETSNDNQQDDSLDANEESRDASENMIKRLRIEAATNEKEKYEKMIKEVEERVRQEAYEQARREYEMKSSNQNNNAEQMDTSAPATPAHQPSGYDTETRELDRQMKELGVLSESESEQTKKDPPAKNSTTTGKTGGKGKK